MLLWMLLMTIVLLFRERETVLHPCVETMPALSSCMPLIKLVLAAGMWRVLVRSICDLRPLYSHSR